MKKTSKILALLMALCLALTAFTACKDSAKDSEEKKISEKAETTKISDKDAIEKAVDEYISTTISSVPEIDEFLAMMDSLEDEMGVSLGIDGNDMVQKIIDTVSYEIKDTKTDGNTATVLCTVKAPDFENMQFDEDGAIADSVLSDIVTEKGYSLDTLAAITDENEQKELLTNLLPEFMSRYMDEMVNAMNKADKISQDATFTLEKKDGKWTVSDDTLA